MTTIRRSPRSVPSLILAAAAALAACSGGTAPSSPPAGSPSVAPPASAVDLPTTDPGGAGSSGTGAGGVVTSPPLVDPVDPGAGQAKLLIPKPGQRDLRPAAPIKLEASVDGRHVLVKVTWYSGVEPCNVLDSVRVERSGGDIAITPMEGTGAGDAICIEIAELHATIVDLGDLEPGAYRIVAPTGEAAPVEITIS